MDFSRRLISPQVTNSFRFLFSCLQPCDSSQSQPPSTLLTEPVMNDAASLNRNTANCAASSAVPTRGIEVSTCGGPCMAIALSSSGVEMVPLKKAYRCQQLSKNGTRTETGKRKDTITYGAIALTRTSGAASLDADRVKPITPCLLVE